MTDEEYETETKSRINRWHGQLKDLESRSDLTGITTLKALIDTELALAETRVKARQAGHPTLTVWLPIIFPTLGAVLGAILRGIAEGKVIRAMSYRGRVGHPVHSS